MISIFPLIPDQLAALLGSPEKAGVGGSIPSLATTNKISNLGIDGIEPPHSHSDFSAARFL